MRISTYMHGVMDYVIGLALLVAPILFRFSGTPATVARTVGVIILLQAVMTRFELGLVKIIPMRVHLMMDYVIGAILAASPWLFGFSDAPLNAWLPHLVVGLLIIGQAAITATPRADVSVMDRDRPRRAA